MNNGVPATYAKTSPQLRQTGAYVKVYYENVQWQLKVG
jgi:hypothetical protein